MNGGVAVRSTVALVSLALVALALTGCSKPATTGATDERIDLFDYLDKGGIKAVEEVFGKPTATLTGVIDMATGATGSGVYEFANGKAYIFRWGYDPTGRAVIAAHLVEPGDSTPTAQDRAFAARFVDGKSTLDEMNRYLTQVSNGSYESVVATMNGPRVKIYVWSLKDGGFDIEDDSMLSESVSRALELDQQGLPYGVGRWDENHVETPF